MWVLDEGDAGSLMGGNKVRKLDAWLAAARAHGATHLVTSGHAGSNHVLATGLYGTRAGLSVAAVLFPGVGGHATVAGEARIATCCTVRQVRGPGAVARAAQEWMQELVAAGHRPFHIPAGGSGPVGNAPWQEVGAALKAEGFDAVVVALGSGGTAAGLAAGLQGSGTAVIGVRAVPRAAIDREQLMAWCMGGPMTIDGDWYGGGYGLADDKVRAVLEDAHREGIMVEQVYTAKSLGAAWARARDGRRVLWVQTASTVRCGG